MSQPKVQMVGSDAAMLRRIGRRCMPLRRTQAHSIRNIGADFAGGRRIVHRVRYARVGKVLQRARRLRRLGRHDMQGLRIARTAFGPAAFFAAAVTGVLPGHLRRVRAAFHSAAVRRPGRRSVTVDLALLDRRADPACAAYGLPIAWLAKELSSATAPRFMIRQCQDKANEVQEVQVSKAEGLSKPTCCIGLAIGPVGAAVATARHIGWSHARGPF